MSKMKAELKRVIAKLEEPLMDLVNMSRRIAIRNEAEDTLLKRMADEH
jgi:hypothetical protein